MLWASLEPLKEITLKKFYFSKFEDRKPYDPIPDNKWRTLLFQFFSLITFGIGLAYINWRWRYSLNMDSLWFAIPLVIAETLSFIGTTLIIINYWSNKDPKKQKPVHYLSEIEALNGRNDRPLRIDVHIATYNEDVELVRYSIIDAKKMVYPFDDVKIQIYVLDDGKRDGSDASKQNMKQVALEEGVIYLSRPNNKGFKAGNLKNGLENSNGDLFVILDADTRPFKNFLIHTTGYFKNRKLAWVQTPQWFYDLTEPQNLDTIINRFTKRLGKKMNAFVTKLFGRIKIGEDLFGNDPRLFYDVLLRRRNFFNSSFCCGAGSIHRREAIMSLAIRDYGLGVRSKIGKSIHKIKYRLKNNYLSNYFRDKFLKDTRNKFVLNQELIPFKFHASEDIYTSIMLHAHPTSDWESIQHPQVECKMLSPQDIDSWVKQRSRYAQGSLDIAFKDNPVFMKGLNIGQKISYFNTIYSYFAPIWIMVFLLSPIIFFYFHSLPVRAYSFDFFKYFIPFQIFNTLLMTIGCWGINTTRGDQYYISCFWLMFTSLIAAIKGKKVTFNVTPKNRVFGKHLHHIYPHMLLIGLTLVGILYNLILIGYGNHPSWSGFLSNTLWGLFNVYNLSIIIRAAYWKPETELNESIM